MNTQTRFAVIVMLLSLVLAACEGDGPEPDAITVHVCDSWCIHAPKPHPPGKWF